MPKFNDRRDGKGEIDLGAQALADAQRDSVGAYGRKHPASKAVPTGGSDNAGMTIAEHHSGDVYNKYCASCASDAKAGNHPRA